MQFAVYAVKSFRNRIRIGLNADLTNFVIMIMGYSYISELGSSLADSVELFVSNPSNETILYMV